MMFREQEISPTEPSSHESKRVCYTILHLGCPANLTGSNKKLQSLMRKASKHLSVKIWIESLQPGQRRYFFRFPWYQRNDTRAVRIAETFLYAASVIIRPFMDQQEEAVVLRLPMELAENSDAVNLDELIQLEESREWNDRTITYAVSTIGHSIHFAETQYEHVWRLMPYGCENDKLFNALRFLTTSLSNFYISPGRSMNVFDDPEARPNTSLDQTALETAMLNAFKAIEAVIGDPPKDDRKLAVRFQDIGLDVNEMVGHGEKRSLGDVIRSMNIERDKTSAHGSTPKRAIKVLDMMEYQACARYIVLSALEHAVSAN